MSVHILHTCVKDTRWVSISFLLRKLRCYFIKHHSYTVLLVCIEFGDGVRQRPCVLSSLILYGLSNPLRPFY